MIDATTRGKALHAYNLWREKRLPEEVRVITVPYSRTAYGDIRIDVTPQMDMARVPEQPQGDFPRMQTADVEMFEWQPAGFPYPVWLGWHDYPATLVIVRMSEREKLFNIPELERRKMFDGQWTSHSEWLASLKDGEPCGHPGCLSHVSHPCEGCGRIAGRWPEECENA